MEKVISKKDLETWFGWMEKYHTTPTSYGANFFTTMYSNRNLTKKETIFWTMKDIKIAAQMGFKVYRTGIIRHEDIDILSECFSLADELGIQIAPEIHSPRGIHTWWTQDFLEEILRKNTKAAGFVLDFGIFAAGMSLAAKKKYLRAGADNKILEAIDEAYRNGSPASDSDIEKMGGGKVEKAAGGEMRRAIHDDPEWIHEILPYTKHCHGKFYEMTDDCKEPAIDYQGPILPFLYLRLKCGLPVLGDFYFHRTIAGIDLLVFITIAVIITFGTLRFLISEMVTHLSFHHFLDRAAEQIFQGILNVFSTLDIILIQQLTNDITFSFCHLYSVYRFLFSCHF